jgi:O-antigen/teichoic acid export membrane protein
VWMGKRYVATSYPVLVILIIPATLMWAQAASGRVLFGISKHRTWAFVTLGEGLVNLLLSIVLVHVLLPTHGVIGGIEGDAFGTAIPLVCTMTMFMPWHLCRLLGIRMRTYLREAFVWPVLISIPLVGSLFLLRRWHHPHNYFQLVTQLLIAGAVYGLGLLWLYKTKRAFKVGELAFKEPPTPIENGRGTPTPVEAYPQDV